MKHAINQTRQMWQESEQRKSKRQELLEKFHAEPYQFPWIKKSDPVSIVLGAMPRDIIRFISDSLTAGASETYRYVI